MHPKDADSMAVSGLGLVKPLVNFRPHLHERVVHLQDTVQLLST